MLPRQLSLNDTVPGFYALIEAVDALPPVLERAESAFVRLADGAVDTAGRLGAALADLERLPLPEIPEIPVAPPLLQDAALSGPAVPGPSGLSEQEAVQDALLETAAGRLDLERRIVATLGDQVDTGGALVRAQEQAVRESGAAWERLSNDIVGNFDAAFAGIADDGAEIFSGIRDGIAGELRQGFAGIVAGALPGGGRNGGSGGGGAGGPGDLVGDLVGGLGGGGAGGLATLFGRLLPFGGGRGGGGLLDIGSSILPGLFSGGSFGLGGIIPGLFGGGALGPVVSALTAGLGSVFADRDFPFAKAVIGIEGGRPAAESAFELDGGPLDTVTALQERIIGALETMVERIGAGFSGNAANFLQIGYASGRKSSLPEGYFVAGLESSGDFATGADLTGIGSEEELTARAVQLALSKALRDNSLDGFSGEADAEARQTFADGLERLMRAPFESLESSFRQIDFLAGFEETVALYRDGAESLDAYNRALRLQKAAIEETGKAAATESFEPVRLFLEDARQVFGAASGDDTADTDRLASAGNAVRGMVDELLEAMSLAGREAPLEGFALLYEQQKAQIAALVPQLQSLNGELGALGLETIDVAASIGAANENLAADMRGRFVAALEDDLSPAHAAARRAMEERDGLLRQARHLGLGDDREVLARIDTLLGRELEKLGFALDESGNMVATFTDSINAATDGIERQISVQRDAVDDFARLAGGLRDARADLAIDDTLSPHAPLERLARAEAAFAGLAEASAGGDLEARGELAESARTYLALARDVHASGEAYADIFREVDAALEMALSSTEAQVSAAERQLDVLVEIRDRLAPPESGGGSLSFRAGSGGEYVSENGGLVSPGYDLGFNPDRAIAILTALDAAGLPLPGGFGEGQLTRLRQQNAAVDAVVSAMGFATGGIMTGVRSAPALPGTGGIALEPSVAVFGEGSLPEAYVPLPDGRTIPVTLSLPANDSGDRGMRENFLRQHADSRELVHEMRRLHGEVAALREDNERLGRLLGRALSRQSA